MKGRPLMPTQEERIALLEQTTREYRPVLSNFAYELTMVKGLIVEQTAITQELRRDMDEVKQDMNEVKTQLSRMEEQLRQILMLLRPS